jgi:hypothetical protein
LDDFFEKASCPLLPRDSCFGTKWKSPSCIHSFSMKNHRPSLSETFVFHSAPSHIHELGLFAGCDLPGRRKIGEIHGPLVSTKKSRVKVAKQRKIYLIELDCRRALDCSQSLPFRFLNHSCRPNCYLRIRGLTVEVYTRRIIPAGTELTLNYHETPHEGGMRCRCGEPGCVGRL